MPGPVRDAYLEERRLASVDADAGDLRAAWVHLERAHVLAQPFPVAHVGFHVAQMALGIRTRDVSEVLGQVVRVVVAGPASLVGRVVGNTGRASVPLRATAPVPHDLADLLETVR